MEDVFGLVLPDPAQDGALIDEKKQISLTEEYADLTEETVRASVRFY